MILLRQRFCHSKHIFVMAKHSCECTHNLSIIEVAVMYSNCASFFSFFHFFFSVCDDLVFVFSVPFLGGVGGVGGTSWFSLLLFLSSISPCS